MIAELTRNGPAKALEGPHWPRGRAPGILVADDLAMVLALLRIEMEGRGFAVWLADDGARAVELYREHREEIDLVLLDVQMPVMDGPQALAALQAIDPLVLACFMTAGTNSYSEESLLQRGAACVFRKPFHTPVVGNLLERLVDGPRAVPAPFSASAPRRWSPRRGRGLPPS